MRHRLVAVCLGLFAGAVVIYELWPMGCGPTDGGPLEGTSRDLCPMNPARIEMITYPDSGTGVVVTLIVAIAVGMGVALLARAVIQRWNRS